MLVLASSSPRRTELLQEWGYEFVVVQPFVTEEFSLTDFPEDVVQNLAKRKALRGVEVWRHQKDVEADILLSADTIVVLGERIFGKPVNEEDAREMLRTLSGKTHKVMTAVALADMGRDSQNLSIETSLDITTVSFRHISDQEIMDYIATGEPMVKAAAYGIQGQAGKFVAWVEGSLTNVIGLPMELLTAKLQEKNIYPNQ